jgi:hypothetical protein
MVPGELRPQQDDGRRQCNFVARHGPALYWFGSGGRIFVQTPNIPGGLSGSFVGFSLFTKAPV